MLEFGWLVVAGTTRPLRGWGRGETPQRPTNEPPPRSGLKVEGRSSAKGSVPKRFRCGTIEKIKILRRVSA